MAENTTPNIIDVQVMPEDIGITYIGKPRAVVHIDEKIIKNLEPHREALKMWASSPVGKEALGKGGRIGKLVNAAKIAGRLTETTRLQVIALLDEVGMTRAGTRDEVVLRGEEPRRTKRFGSGKSEKLVSDTGGELGSVGAPRSRVNRKYGGAPRGRRREEVEIPGMRRRKPDSKLLPPGPDGKPRKPSPNWGYEPDKETMPDVIVAKFLELQSQGNFDGAIEYIKNYMSSHGGQKEEVRLNLLKELGRMKLADRIDIKSELKENGIDLDQSFLPPKASAKPEAPKGPKYGETSVYKVNGGKTTVTVAIGSSSTNEKNLTFYVLASEGEPLRKKTGGVYAPTPEKPQTWGIVIEEKEGRRRIVKKKGEIPGIPRELQAVANRLAKEYLDNKYGKPAEEAKAPEKKPDVKEPKEETDIPEKKADAKEPTKFKKITTEIPEDHEIRGMVCQVKITVNTASRGRIAGVEFVSARKVAGGAMVKAEEAKKEGIEFGKVYTLSELPGAFKYYFKRNAGEIYARLTGETEEEKSSPKPADAPEEPVTFKKEEPESAPKPKKAPERQIRAIVEEHSVGNAKVNIRIIADSSRREVLTVELVSTEAFQGMTPNRPYEIAELPEYFKKYFLSKGAPTYNSVISEGEIIPAESSLPLEARDWQVYLEDMTTEDELVQFKERMIASGHWQENKGVLVATEKKYIRLMRMWREKKEQIAKAVDAVSTTITPQRALKRFTELANADNSDNKKRTANNAEVRRLSEGLKASGWVRMSEAKEGERPRMEYNPACGADEATKKIIDEICEVVLAKAVRRTTSDRIGRKKKDEAVSAESVAESITPEKAIELFDTVRTKSDFIRAARMCEKAGLLQITVEEGRLKGMKVIVGNKDQANKLARAISDANKRYRQGGNGDKEPKSATEGSVSEEATTSDKPAPATTESAESASDTKPATGNAVDKTAYKIMTPTEITEMLFKYMERKPGASNEDHIGHLLLGAGWAITQGERGGFLEVIKELKSGHAPQVRRVYYKPKEGINEKDVMDVLEALEVVVGDIPQNAWGAKNVGYKLVVAKKGEKPQHEEPKKSESKKARESQAVMPFNGTVIVESKEVTVEEYKNDEGVRAWRVTASNHPKIEVGFKGTMAEISKRYKSLKKAIDQAMGKMERKAEGAAERKLAEEKAAAKDASKKPDDDGNGYNGSSSGGGEKPSPTNGGGSSKKPSSKAERKAAMARRAQQDVAAAAAKKTQGASGNEAAA